MEWSAFFEVHKDLPREGPGEAADVLWALDVAGIEGAVSVLDAGCGPGADIVTLASALPEALVTGIDKHPQFVEAAQARTKRFGDRVSVMVGDMAKPGGPYDFIWCAGALYFLGVTEGLTLWRDALAPNGAVAFSEPELLPGPQPDSVREFWEEYPEITDAAGIEGRIKSAGYRIEGKRLIVGSSWEEYYAPMKARIAALRLTDPDEDLSQMLDLCQREIDLWEAAPEHIAYALYVVRPE